MELIDQILEVNKNYYQGTLPAFRPPFSGFTLYSIFGLDEDGEELPLENDENGNRKLGMLDLDTPTMIYVLRSLIKNEKDAKLFCQLIGKYSNGFKLRGTPWGGRAGQVTVEELQKVKPLWDYVSSHIIVDMDGFWTIPEFEEEDESITNEYAVFNFFHGLRELAYKNFSETITNQIKKNATMLLPKEIFPLNLDHRMKYFLSNCAAAHYHGVNIRKIPEAMKLIHNINEELIKAVYPVPINIIKDDMHELAERLKTIFHNLRDEEFHVLRLDDNLLHFLKKIFLSMQTDKFVHGMKHTLDYERDKLHILNGYKEVLEELQRDINKLRWGYGVA